MARKSKVQIEAESAMANLVCIGEMAQEAPDGSGAVYQRNASDCTRWCTSLRNAGVAYPAFMQAGGLRYFAAMWRLPAERI